jgi:polar amino acid transport system substrate-binding protein
MSHRRVTAAMLACVAFVAAGCGSSSHSSSSPTTGASSSSTSGSTGTSGTSGSGSSTTAGSTTAAGPLGAACSPGTLKTVKKGVLTLGADDPLYSPWYEDNNPANGKGFEDAVAYAIAKELGYSTGQVHWTRVTFDAAIQPGPKSFDYDLDEFTITATRAKAVDFSAPYYTDREAIVVMKGTSADKPTTLAGLKKLSLGAQVGSTDYTAIVDQIKPSSSPKVYNTNDDALEALQDNQVQGVVVDLPTAFEITSGEVKGSTILGQLPPSGSPQQFGALLNLGSPLTSCVDKAVKAITADGTLAKITTKWLTQAGDAPVIK